jgi:membrane-bound serine protease (ClpP class)
MQGRHKSVLIRPLLLLLVWVLSTSLVASIVHAQEGDGADRPVVHLRADGPLTPALTSYLERGLDYAWAEAAEAVILELDTPGGQVDIMQDIVSTIRESPVPVVVYVAPRGAAAFSAGTLIVLSGHVSAMAPETAIGAASPVGMETELTETAEKKAKSAVKSLARDLAAPRGEEVIAWAEATVEDAVAASASEALELGAIDLIANDLEDLLTQLDGFEVDVLGEQQTLRTASARLERLPMSLIEQVLHIVVNPTIVLTLLAIGVQALLIEISNPGGWVAGFVGIVSIALAVYGLGVLPFNALGLVLIALAIGLFVMDIKAPTHGALTAAGVAALIAGGLILFNTDDAADYARISLPALLVIAACFASTFLFIMTKALRAQRPPSVTGKEGLIGSIAEARIDLDPDGKVFLNGEYWTAVAEDPPISAGEMVQVVSVDGFRLRVNKVLGAE